MLVIKKGFKNKTMTLEQAQIFFYITIPVCLILATLVFVITKVIVYGKINKILKKVLGTIEEVESKIQMFKLIIEELKNKILDLQFYTEKAEEFTNKINEIKDGIKETFDKDEDEDIEKKSKTKKQKTTKKKTTNKKSSK